MPENNNRTNKRGNQTGSQSGNPRNQELQRNQTNAGAGNQNTISKDSDAPRRKSGNSSGGDRNHGGNR